MTREVDTREICENRDGPGTVTANPAEACAAHVGTNTGNAHTLIEQASIRHLAS